MSGPFPRRTGDAVPLSHGQPVVLLHGQPGSARDWDGVRRAIGDRLVTIALDRPGWDGHRPATDLEANAAAVLALLDSRGLPSATIVGHSFGGAIAAWLAASDPGRVAALVLAAPSANVASLQRLDRVLASPVAGDLLAASAFAGAGAALALPSLRGRIARALGLDDRYLQAAGRDLVRPAAWRAFTTEQRHLVRDLPRLEARLDRISAPTVIAVGTADVIVRPSSARCLAAAIPGASLVEVPRATHLLPQQRPVLLAELIVEAAGAVGAVGA